jgi:glycerol-3-phosphate dehydrogenase
LFPSARRERLRGGALWYDAVMADSQRLLMETLRWACAHGARCLNYVEATGLRVDGDRVRGVEASDRVSGDRLVFEAGTVINCAGPWSERMAAVLGEPVDDLFTPSLAFNLLFEREAPSEVAVAVRAPGRDAHTWFLYPRGGLLYAGTAHFPWPDGAAHAGSTEEPAPGKEQIGQVIDRINAAVPKLELRRHQVLRVYAGLLPARRTGGAELSDRPHIHDHGAAGGPAGLLSVSGVKYTTARDVAETALRRLFDPLPPIDDGAGRPEAAAMPSLAVGEYGELDEDTAAAVRRFADDEAVVYAEDLLLRRGGWADDPRRLQRIADAVAGALRRPS